MTSTACVSMSTPKMLLRESVCVRGGEVPATARAPVQRGVAPEVHFPVPSFTHTSRGASRDVWYAPSRKEAERRRDREDFQFGDGFQSRRAVRGAPSTRRDASSISRTVFAAM